MVSGGTTLEANFGKARAISQVDIVSASMEESGTCIGHGS